MLTLRKCQQAQISLIFLKIETLFPQKLNSSILSFRSQSKTCYLYKGIALKSLGSASLSRDTDRPVMRKSAIISGKSQFSSFLSLHNDWLRFIFLVPNRRFSSFGNPFGRKNVDFVPCIRVLIVRKIHQVLLIMIHLNIRTHVSP